MFHDAELFGRLTGWLFSHRQIRTRIPKGEYFKEGEKELSLEIRQIEDDERAFLMDYFAFNGFKLIVFGWEEFKGIPEGGQIWTIIRDPLAGNPPPWISEAEARARLSLGTESKKVTCIWTLVIYLHYLSYAYTLIGRHPSEISRYVDAVFTKNQLFESLKEWLNELAKENSQKTEITAILTSESEPQLYRRVSKLLDFLKETNCISFSKEDDAYSQTLLGAAEVFEHYDGEISYLVPKDEITESDLESILFEEQQDNTLEN